MKVNTTAVLTVLLLGSLWGAVEVFAGERLYAAGWVLASVPLTIAALGALSVGRTLVATPGSSTAMAVVAVAYKAVAMSVATPWYSCHLWGIVLLGLSYDVVFSALPGRSYVAVKAAGATYLSCAVFAVLLTYGIGYKMWPAGGIMKVLRHVIVDGSLAAIGGAILAVAACRLAPRLRPPRFTWRPAVRYLAASGGCVALAALWLAGILPRILAPS